MQLGLEDGILQKDCVCVAVEQCVVMEIVSSVVLLQTVRGAAKHFPAYHCTTWQGCV